MRNFCSPRLAGYTALDTQAATDIEVILAVNFHSADVDVPDKKRFKLVYNYLDLGSTSINAATATSSYTIAAEADNASFVFIFLYEGELLARAKNIQVNCLPGAVGAVLDFNIPATVAINNFYNNITIRFDRFAAESMLEKTVGKPLRRPLAFTPQVELANPLRQRLLAIIEHIVSQFEQDTNLAQSPMLKGQYDQLLLAGLLDGLDHNARQLFETAAPPAAPKIVALSEAYIEANADKPLRLTDLADLTGLGVRSIQLAFRKHRGYSPSAFLRECRLARARDMLRQAEPGKTVLSVALACGFASQGLFARLYRKRYGETPSVTAGKRRR